MRKLMRETVREWRGLIERMGYEDASLDEQYNLVVNYQNMMAD